MTSWGPLILTEVVPVGVLLCEVAIFRYNEFRSGEYLWLSNSYTVTVAYLWEVFQIVFSSTWSYTDSICKMNGN